MDAMDSRGIRVFVCDRQPLVCEGLTAILEREPDISVTGAATLYDEAVSAAGQHGSTVVVIGHDPPEFDGIELAKRLAEGTGGQMPMLLLDGSSINGNVAQALRAGARGVMCKDQAPGMLAATIRHVSSGAVVVTQPAASHLVTQLVPTEQPGVPDTERCLSSRENEVLRLLARGLNNREIATTLTVSVATVKSHVYSLCRKLDLRDRTHAVILAYETGIVRPDNGHSKSA
jgi:DNA-binding NarL/FixJ family response regulator